MAEILIKTCNAVAFVVALFGEGNKAKKIKLEQKLGIKYSSCPECGELVRQDEKVYPFCVTHKPMELMLRWSSIK